VDFLAPLVVDPRTGTQFASRTAQSQYFGASRYLVKFGLPTGTNVGTYSYSIDPTGIHDRVRNPVNPTTTSGRAWTRTPTALPGETSLAAATTSSPTPPRTRA